MWETIFPDLTLAVESGVGQSKRLQVLDGGIKEKSFSWITLSSLTMNMLSGHEEYWRILRDVFEAGATE